MPTTRKKKKKGGEVEASKKHLLDRQCLGSNHDTFCAFLKWLCLHSGEEFLTGREVVITMLITQQITNINFKDKIYGFFILILILEPKHYGFNHGPKKS